MLTTKLGPRLAEARANGVVEEQIHAPYRDRSEVVNLHDHDGTSEVGDAGDAGDAGEAGEVSGGELGASLVVRVVTYMVY